MSERSLHFLWKNRAMVQRWNPDAAWPEGKDLSLFDGFKLKTFWNCFYFDIHIYFFHFDKYPGFDWIKKYYFKFAWWRKNRPTFWIWMIKKIQREFKNPLTYREETSYKPSNKASYLFEIFGQGQIFEQSIGRNRNCSWWERNRNSTNGLILEMARTRV